MKLVEIFNSKIDLDWQKHGRFELSQFFVNETPYIIQIEKRPILELQLEDSIKTAEVSFFRHDIENEKKAFSTQQENIKVPYVVYGAVGNALKQKFNNYDLFYFTAEKKHSNNTKEYEQKIQIYRSLCIKLKKDSLEEVFYYENEDSTKYEFIISKIEIPELKNPLKEALKECFRK